MRTLVNFLVGVAQWVGITLFAALTVCLFWSVVIRFFAIFGGSLPWVEEFARFTFIWMSFLGAIVALDRAQHITIDLLAKALPHPVQTGLAYAVDVAILVFLTVYAVKGADLVRLTGDQFSPQLNIPMSAIHAVIPVSGAVMILQMLCRLGARLRWRGETPTPLQAE
jgi:TRAP-type C4-dicarboxylate transport system permease small subunit